MNIEVIFSLVQYIIEKAQHSTLGLFKLSKLVYLTDFMFYKKYQRSEVNARYVHLDKCPSLGVSENVLDEIRENELIEYLRNSRSSTPSSHSFRNLTAPDMEVLSPELLSVADEIIVR